MEDEAGTKEVIAEKEEKTAKEEIFTKVVRAGKRTYFFDVKATRREDYYLTITESKKRLGKEGKVFYEKHKIFLYKEDFEKFSEGLKGAVDYISNDKESAITEPVVTAPEVLHDQEKTGLTAGEFSNIDFEDLGKE
jgi:hypothetical protein